MTPVLVLASAVSSVAQSGMPAVAYPNAVLGVEAGSWFNQAFATGEARFAVPLSHSLGGQLDGIIGSIGGQTYAQVSGHLFWRDPSAALFGLYGAWVYQGGMSSGRIGPEAEIYLNNVTLSGVAGAAFGNGTTNFFAHGKASLYLTPNQQALWWLRLRGPGHRHRHRRLRGLLPGPAHLRVRRRPLRQQPDCGDGRRPPVLRRLQQGHDGPRAAGHRAAVAARGSSRRQRMETTEPPPPTTPQPQTTTRSHHHRRHHQRRHRRRRSVRALPSTAAADPGERHDVADRDALVEGVGAALRRHRASVRASSASRS